MKIYKQIHSTTPEQTEGVGAELAKEVLSGALPCFIALEGDLGVGKTAFTRGFVSVVSPASAVRSPTFALVNEYRNRETSKVVYHFDVYRIIDDDDLYSTGFYDYLDRGICVVEWSENIRYAFPDSYVTVRIEKNDENDPDSRLITVFRD